MFKIYDGRECFYQWDLNRKLIVEDKSIKEVHFCNRTNDCALKSKAYALNGLWVADVPNILFQNDWCIRVYAYDGAATLHEVRFDVITRSKPADYVYTEEEIKAWEALDERIDEIEKNGVSDERVGEAVEAYLTEHPFEAPVTSVNGKTGAVELTAEDVNALSADTVIPSTEGLATETYVNEAVSNVKVDLTGYATEKYVNEKIAAIDIPETDLSNYATKEYVNQEITNAQLGGDDVDLSNYYTKEETDALIPSTAGLATESYVQEEISKIDIPETDLSNYYTKNEVDALIPDVSGYTTMAAVEAKGYQTAAQVETAISEAIAAIVDGEEVAY